MESGWLQRSRDSRALTITADGRAAFASLFGIDMEAPGSRGERAAA